MPGVWKREGCGLQGCRLPGDHLGSMWFAPALVPGCRPRALGSSVASYSGPRPVSFPLGSEACPVSLMMTLSTLYLLEEDLVGSQVEPALPAASGEASEQSLPLGLGPSVRIREQWPLSSLSSVLLYRTAPGDLKLVFYDEVCEREMWGVGSSRRGGNTEKQDARSRRLAGFGRAAGREGRGWWWGRKLWGGSSRARILPCVEGHLS